jgi:ABC-type bacteriocin/lantibiotic exporter with double-glycine peptidase domain
MSKGRGKKSRTALFDRKAWRYFIAFYQGQYKRLAVTAAMSTAQSLLIVPSLLLVKYAFDKAIPQHNIHLIVLVGTGILGFRLANTGLTLWVRSINTDIIGTAIFKLREDILSRLYMFARSAYTRLDQKTTHARIVQDTERLSNMSEALISRLFPSIFTSLALCVILLVFNWLLFLIMISIFPVIYFANRYTGRLVKEKVYIFQRSFETFSKGVMFVLRHMDLTRLQTAEEQEIERQTRTLKELRSKTRKMTLIYDIHSNVQSSLSGLSGIIIVVVGGISVANHSITIGEFIAFYFAAGFLNGYVNTITGSIADIIAGNESIVTLYGLAETKNIQPYGGKKQVSFKGALSLESVSFGYEDQPVLENISLCLQPHSRIAIIGPNGAGKSTIIQLMLGFYRPSAGRLYADDISYEDIDMVSLRRRIGVVTQDPALFSGTVLENISYGSVAAERKQITHAAGLAMADEFIRKLPAGYDTQIGEDGILLSGGERQRLALARALFRRPKLLILDEPTNHLDRTSVRQFLDNLEGLDDRPGILMITHDMSVVSHADEVYRLEKGGLVRCVTVPVSL